MAAEELGRGDVYMAGEVERLHVSSGDAGDDGAEVEGACLPRGEG